MGSSGGGYAAILFGSLCNVSNVIAFASPTKLFNEKFKEYRDLKTVINTTTQYTLYGNMRITNENDPHHISHFENIEEFANVKVIKRDQLNLKAMCSSQEIKKILDESLQVSKI
jgi:hypothetical protein